MTQTDNPWVRTPAPKPPETPGADEPNPIRAHHAARGKGRTWGRRRVVDLRESGSGGLPPVVAPLSGPPTPQRSVPSQPALPRRQASPFATMWVVGAHGGAGESTLSAWHDTWAAGEHAWPVPAVPGRQCPVVLVARTSARGLVAAQAALTQWAAGGAGPEVDLLGLVLIADAPGKLPKPLRDLATVVRGGAPRVWDLPWSEPVRLDDPDALASSRSFTRLVSELRSLAPEASAPGESH